ncbi:hypothetical protein Tco_0624222 [Tanacetum coccineum]|uniref:Uncharacterized protein n=1 Tax=Tanacetum coccineum TaxID=301880 RepID=A0ABQ4WDE7_9ASTR
MYYPRFTKLIVNFVMSKDPSILRINQINWHYARDDPMFTTLNVISRNEDTQLYGAILPKELTNEDIRNSESYKEYYAIASGEVPPKTKARKKKVDSETTAKQKPPTDPKEKKVKKNGRKNGKQKAKKDQGNEVDRDTNANLEGRDDVMEDVVVPQVQVTQEIKGTHVTLTPRSNPSSAPNNFTPNTGSSLTQLQQPPILTPATTPSSLLQNLPNFGLLFGFDNRLKALEDNFLEFKQTNQYAEALSSSRHRIDCITMANKLNVGSCRCCRPKPELRSDRIPRRGSDEILTIP